MNATSLGNTFRTGLFGIGTIPYDAGNTKTLDIKPIQAQQKNLTLRLQGNLVIAGAAATIHYDNPLGLLKSIELIADGRRTIFRASGRQLYNYAHFIRGRRGQLLTPVSSTGTRPFAVTLVLDHEAKQFYNPVESVFDMKRYKTLELKVQWGLASEMATAGGGGTIAIDTANTFVDVLQETTIDAESLIKFDHVLMSKQFPITASNPRLEIDIPQTGLLAGIQIQCTRDAGAGAGVVPVDDIVNTLQLESDTSVNHAKGVRWRTLQAKNAQQFQLTEQLGGDLTVPGYVYYKLNENGAFGSALNVAQINKTQLVLDVTRTSGTEMVDVLFDFFEPLRNAA